jgi:hypothetical protein
MTLWAGVAQLVELQPSKLDVASSSLVSRSIWYFIDKLSELKFEVPKVR